MLLALVAVVAIVWLLIAQPWSGAASERSATPQASPTPTEPPVTLPVPDGDAATPKPSSTPTATTTPVATTPTPKPSSTAPTAAACTAADLEVEPLTDADSYTSKQKPKLSIALTNKGDAGCTLNVGTSTQKFVISSGSDTWWRSTDCQSTPSDQVVLLGAGQRVVSAAPLVWDRTRSSVKTCTATDRAKAPGGGASYHLSVQIGGVESEGTAQFLLY